MEIRSNLSLKKHCGKTSFTTTLDTGISNLTFGINKSNITVPTNEPFFSNDDDDAHNSIKTIKYTYRLDQRMNGEI